MKNVSLKIIVMGFIMMLIHGCNLFPNKDNQPTTDKMKFDFGSYQQIGNSNIGSSGGVLSITSGDLSGMTLTVPSNSYTNTKPFIVSTADIGNSEFGKYIKPLTPVIKVENGGGYANRILELKIPVKIPDGHFPLAFYLDENTQKLEPIPINAYSSSSVTVTTRHFSTSSLTSGYTSSGGARQKSGSPYANLIISSMAESVINNSSIIASGFKPGTDDWEFINKGSYLATGGHCAGQNMAAMWYYFEKKPTEGKLFNKFNTVDKIQEENSQGYRFSSVIHRDLEWDGEVVRMFDKYIDKNQSLDKYKWYAIAGAMLVTGEPQGVGIYIPDGVSADGTPKYGGHDLICYQVDVKSGQLYISDPNTPGKGQTINLTGEKFDPYIASYIGGEQGRPFPYVTYYAKTAYIDWEKIGKRWAEVLNKKIGSVAPNNFPDYSFWVNDGAGYEIKDSLNTDLDTLRLVTVSANAQLYYPNKFNGKYTIGTKVYDEKGNLLVTQDGTHKKFVLLKPGINKLGVYVYAWKSTAKTGSNYKELYIDFKWITVTFAKPTMKVYDGSVFLEGQFEANAINNGTVYPTWTKIYSFGDFFSQTTIKESNGTITGTFTHDPYTNFQMTYNPTTLELNNLNYTISKKAPNGDIDEESLKISSISSKYLEKTETKNFIYYTWSVKGAEVKNFITEAKKHWTNNDSYGKYEEWTGKIATNNINLSISITFQKL